MRFAAERLIEYITRASDEFRDATATATILPALGVWTARADTLFAYVAGFFEPPPSEPRVRALVSVAVADSSTPSVSSLLSAARPPHVATTAGLTVPLAPPVGRRIVSRRALERSAVAEGYVARLLVPMSSTTSSSPSRLAPAVTRSPFNEPHLSFVPLRSPFTTSGPVMSYTAASTSSFTPPPRRFNRRPQQSTHCRTRACRQCYQSPRLAPPTKASAPSQVISTSASTPLSQTIALVSTPTTSTVASTSTRAFAAHYTVARRLSLPPVPTPASGVLCTSSGFLASSAAPSPYSMKRVPSLLSLPDVGPPPLTEPFAPTFEIRDSRQRRYRLRALLLAPSRHTRGSAPARRRCCSPP